MIPSKELKFVASWNAQQGLIEYRIRELAYNNRHLEILEAGCGQNWDINLEGVNYSLTGVDIDTAALAIRMKGANDLDKAIEGDLRYVEFDNNSFDVIYNVYVLEHVDGAEAVLSNFVKWLRPGGIMILKIPDPDSVKGFFTRITPHWFHIFYFRYILDNEAAGLPGHAPFRTYFDKVVSRKGLHEFCKNNELTILDEYKNGLGGSNRGVKVLLVEVFSRLCEVLSFGLLSARHQNLLYILRRDPIVDPRGGAQI